MARSDPPHVTKTRGPLSIATAGVYLVPAVILLPDHPFAVFAFCVLAIGTFLFHAFGNDKQLDGAGMLASVGALIGLPFGLIVQGLTMAGGLALVGFYSHKLIAALILPVGVVAVCQGAWAWFAGALVLFVIGFLIWRRPGDWPHAVWHVTTCAAMTLILIGI